MNLANTILLLLTLSLGSGACQKNAFSSLNTHREAEPQNESLLKAIESTYAKSSDLLREKFRIKKNYPNILLRWNFAISHPKDVSPFYTPSRVRDLKQGEFGGPAPIATGPNYTGLPGNSFRAQKNYFRSSENYAEHSGDQKAYWYNGYCILGGFSNEASIATNGSPTNKFTKVLESCLVAVEALVLNAVFLPEAAAD